MQKHLKTDKVLVEVDNFKAIVTMNRPERLNALDIEMWHRLGEAAKVIEAEPDLRVVLLTGTGRAFCAGLDIKEVTNPETMLTNLGFNNFYEGIKYLRDIFSMYQSLPIPVIAAINGACIGGGMEITLACDIRLAADTAVFSIPEVVYGIIPDCGGTQRLPRIVGPSKARELIYTGSKIDAAEALRIGLVDYVYPPDDLMVEASRLAEQIASQPPAAVQAAKRALNMAMSTGLQEGLDFESATALSVNTGNTGKTALPLQ